MRHQRVLILSASAGTGHVRAAEALERAFKQRPTVAEVAHVDALRFTNKIFRDFYSRLYTQLVENAPTLLGWWYKQSDEPWKTDRMRFMLDRLNLGPLIEFIEDFSPHTTICTHFLPAEIISHLIEKQRISARLSITVTDFDFHAMWLTKTFHRYFVALEETKIHLSKLGLPPERIAVTGIPIHPEFRPCPIEERPALRQSVGLKPHLPTLLLSAGALGVTPAQAILETLRDLTIPAQIVVICGKNESLLQSILQTIERNPFPSHLHITPLGYTQQMHTWMRVADLYIGKPGGLTISEALSTGLPMVITSPIPGQEERNSDHLLEKGAAIKCNTLTTLPYKIESLLNHPTRLQSMRRAALQLAQPHATQKIVSILLRDHTEKTDPILIPKEQQRAMALRARLQK
ncbi:MAG: UDP-N-acetylglucosamine 2-epimerase [Methylacidiphilales bacterium]|nr:UDP-N-acetylglucosamine 2-epimerase [Candidatus Methylacidiphilales bacterium]MDW8349486.1 glycosyltransferase [Verrucomicrobiae bacterium]